MKSLFLLTILISVGYAGTNLDSLVNESQKGEQRAKHVGWLAGQKKPLITGAYPVGGGKAKSLWEETNQDTLIKQLSQKVEDLQSSQEKLTLIVASLQSSSNTHSDNQDFILKLVEIFMGAIVTLLAAYITAKITKKI